MMLMLRCEKRMGRLVKQDLGISIRMLEELLRLYDIELREQSTTLARKRKIVICAGTFVILFGGALYGGEVLMMLEASEFVKRRDDGRNLKENGHIVVPLMGRFKNETGKRILIIVLSNVTKSGLQIQKWIDRFTALLLSEGKGRTTGPAICDKDGFVLENWKINAGELHEMLKRVQSLSDGVIPGDIDVERNFNTYRLFQRGATTRAKEQGVSEAMIGLNNRWRLV
jgi:hypothetical protein